MKKETLRNGIKILQKAGFPGDRKFDKTTYDVWESLLKDIDDDSFMRAMRECALTLKFFPTIAEIREKALKSPGLLPEIAWSEVLDQIQKVCGTGNKATFSTPLIESVVHSLGGLNQIWEAGADQEHYYRMNFIKTYDLMAQKLQQDKILGLPTKEDATKILDDLGFQLKKV